MKTNSKILLTIAKYNKRCYLQLSDSSVEKDCMASERLEMSSSSSSRATGLTSVKGIPVNGFMLADIGVREDRVGSEEERL
jgi:hypothetical protein